MPDTKQKSTRRDDGGAVRGEREGGVLLRESDVTGKGGKIKIKIKNKIKANSEECQGS